MQRQIVYFEETIDSETLFLIDHYSNDKVSVQYSFVYGIDRIAPFIQTRNSKGDS